MNSNATGTLTQRTGGLKPMLLVLFIFEKKYVTLCAVYETSDIEELKGKYLKTAKVIAYILPAFVCKGQFYLYIFAATCF